jgi:ATP-dependent exoDNAse (exonuclease V) beta subunit
MQNETGYKPFKIYKSSAGSGKTYTLVLTYLSILLTQKDAYYFRKVLAVTFTNKAAAEMKERVVQGLEKLIRAEDNSFMQDYVKATQLSPDEISLRAREILTAILHDYSSFSILTIDKFVHRIIRSFSRELGLTTNFELETDHETFYKRSIDQLLGTLGQDKQLTNFLVQFQQSLFEEERVNSIEKSLLDLSKLLHQENSKELLDFYADKDLTYFIAIREKTRVLVGETRGSLKEKNRAVLNLFESNGFDMQEWKLGNTAMYAPFVKIARGDTANILTDAQTKHFSARILTNDLLHKRNSALAVLLDNQTPFIVDQLDEMLLQIRDLGFLEHIYNELVAFSLLHAIRTIFETIREENNLIFIKDFNDIISNVVKNEPTPFIYEKIGTRYRHILIDEFQDTSRMQWQNLIPLVYESLSSHHTNLIVGDAKQAIYRFRGGDAQQFVDLPQTEAPLADIDHINSTFKETHELLNLDVNYRSTPEIITFNNWIFEEYVLKTDTTTIPESIKAVYQGFQQNIHRTDSGVVQVNVLGKAEKGAEDELNKQEKIHEQLLNNITACLRDGFLPDDICILVRGQRDGAVVSRFLLEQGYSVVSVDSIILGNSKAVMDIIHHFRAIQQPVESAIARCFLNTTSETTSALFEKYRIPNTTNTQYSIGYRFDDYLTDYFVGFSVEAYENMSLFDKIDYLIRLKNYPRTDPYLDKLLNVTYDFMRMNGSNGEQFIQHFFESAYKEKVNAQIAGGSIQLMTIHKSKGLQFPIVMIPYDFGARINDKDMGLIGDDRSTQLGLPAISTRLVSKLKDWGFEDRLQLHTVHALLDDINLYYVALTRPEKRLYLTLFADQGIPAQLKTIIKNHPSYNSDMNQLVIGTPSPVHSDALKEPIFEKLPHTISWRDTLELSPSKGYLDEEENQSENEQAFGNYLHEIISLNKVLNQLEEDAKVYCSFKQLSQEMTNRLLSIAKNLQNDKQFGEWMRTANEILREREMVNAEGKIVRPDMIFLLPEQWILVDFKTGQPKPGHRKQLNEYGAIIAKLPQVISNPIQVNKYLIYLSEEKIEYAYV